MARTIKHLSLHRIAGTELRVLADVDNGVLPVIEVEEMVIRRYVKKEDWPHRWVSLFILEDLQPLIRQLRLGVQPSSVSPTGPALGNLAKFAIRPVKGHSQHSENLLSLANRAVVNIYDLADLSGCNVFANRQVLLTQNYWGDPLALQGLLAHEHAHPLSENPTTQSSRQLSLEILLAGDQWQKTAEKGGGPSIEPQPAKVDYRERIPRLLTSLAHKLCLSAPREIFSNVTTIQNGFAEALLHLNRHNLENAARSVQGRRNLIHQLQRETNRGNLSPIVAGWLLLIGDMSGYLDLALELAPFYRSQRTNDGQVLESMLRATVFPHLDPLVPPAFTALRDRYIALAEDLDFKELLRWSQAVLDILVRVLAEKGLESNYRLSPMTARSEPGV